MASRHYLAMMDTQTIEVFRQQVLGNNDCFDDEFYEALGIELDIDGDFGKTEVNIEQFAKEWYKFLHRNENLLGFPKPFENDIEERPLHFFLLAESYELQMFTTMSKIANTLIDNSCLENPEDRYQFTLECY